MFSLRLLCSLSVLLELLLESGVTNASSLTAFPLVPLSAAITAALLMPAIDISADSISAGSIRTPRIFI